MSDTPLSSKQGDEPRYVLWKHLLTEHNLTLLQSELDEIIDLARAALPPSTVETTECLVCDSVTAPGMDLCNRCESETPLRAVKRLRTLSLGLAAVREQERRASEPPSDVQRDAERWRALIGCARIRVMGSAGLHDPQSNYAHIGVEFWTHHKAQSHPRDIETILKFVERAGVTKDARCVWSKNCERPPREGSLLCDEHYGQAGETPASRACGCMGGYCVKKEQKWTLPSGVHCFQEQP